MKRKVIKLISSVLILLNLTGCWDAYDISQNTIVSLVGVDYSVNKYNMTVEVINISKGPSSGENKANKSDTVLGTGNSLVEARNDIENKNPNKLYLGAIRAVVFSGGYSSEIGIEEYLSRIKGNHEYRKSISLLTTDTDIETLFNDQLSGVESVGFSIESLISFHHQNGAAYPAYASAILEHSLVKDAGYVLNNVELKDKKIELTGYSVFKKNKKIGFIPNAEKNGVNIFILDRAALFYTMQLKDSLVTMSAKIDKKKITPSYHDNIGFSIDIEAKGEIISQSKINKISKDETKELEKNLSQLIKADIMKATNDSSQKFGCDYLFLYMDFRAKYNTAFKTINYEEKFRQAKFNVNVKTSIVPGNMVKID